MASGERVTTPESLMLGDYVRFTNSALEWNRDRQYKVIIIRQDSIVVRAYGTFVTADFFDYTIMGYQLESLGTEVLL